MISLDPPDKLIRATPHAYTPHSKGDPLGRYIVSSRKNVPSHSFSRQRKENLLKIQKTDHLGPGVYTAPSDFTATPDTHNKRNNAQKKPNLFNQTFDQFRPVLLLGEGSPKQRDSAKSLAEKVLRESWRMRSSQGIRWRDYSKNDDSFCSDDVGEVLSQNVGTVVVADAEITVTQGSEVK